ncbi:MAG: BamA/TamA family outer membrane protein [Cytophagaceae bacterium]
MKSIYYILFFAGIFLLNYGCAPVKHLREDQYLLYSQKIKGNKKIGNDELSQFYRQTPNNRFLGLMPYVHIYYFGKRFYDSTAIANEIQETEEDFNNRIEKAEKERKKERLRNRKDRKLEKLKRRLREGNWLMRAPGEPPAIYDSSLMEVTRRQMNYFLTAQGYFRSRVTATADTSGKKVTVRFNVFEGPAYYINSFNDTIEDANIRQLVHQVKGESPIKPGERYKEEHLTAERERINRLMKDNGYFDFSRQYIFFHVDSTVRNHRVDIQLIIRNPPGTDGHKQYHIEQVIYNTDISYRPDQTRDTMSFRNVEYVFYNKRFSRKILDSKVSFKPGKLYNQSDVQRTQRQLGGMDMYKFVSINFEKKETDTLNTLIGYINTSPLQKYSLTQEYGINVGQALVPGPFGNITIRSRNFLKAYELYETSFRYAIDGQYGFTEEGGVFRTYEYGVNTSVTFPVIFFPTRLRFLFRDYNPKTRFQSGYNLQDRFEFNRQTIRAALTYSWMPRIYKQFFITPIDVNIINSKIRPSFNEYLEELAARGNNLRVSFRNAIVTSYNMYYVYNNNEFGKVKPSKYFRPFLEIGGLLPALAGRGSGTLFDLQYFQFYRASSDIRFYKPTSPTNVFVIRFNGGVARPFGKGNLGVLPYEKYFFAGGSNSIRAWHPRRLGPGSYKQPTTGIGFEQPGEILFENNYEYRFKIMGFFDGALFVDAGNVWTLEEGTRPGSQFQLDKFYQQIAVGAGYGIRLNFSFLILRFDIGSKIYDPGEPAGDKFVGKYLIQRPPFGRRRQTVVNIGIGYPF